MADLYQTLGIDRDASASDIKSAYRNLVKEHHPDKGGDPEMFIAITTAWDVLSDPDAKAQYDVSGTFNDKAVLTDRQLVVQCLASLFQQLIQIPGSLDDDVNIIVSMRQQLVQQRAGAAATLIQIDEHEKGLKGLRDRLDYTGAEDNLFTSTIDTNLRQGEEAREKLISQQRIREKCLEELDLHKTVTRMVLSNMRFSGQAYTTTTSAFYGGTGT